MTERTHDAVAADIQAARRDLDAIMARVEDAREAFEGAAAAFAASWYPRAAREVARTEDAVTGGQTTAGLAALKVEIAGLADRASEEARRVMRSPEDWWHLKPEQCDPEIPEPRNRNGATWFPMSYRFNGHTPPSGPDRAVRRLLGALIGVMQPFGYVVDLGYSATLGKPRPRPGDPIGGHFEWPPELRRALDRYRDEQEKGAAIVSSLRNKLYPELKRAEAARKWDEA